MLTTPTEPTALMRVARTVRKETISFEEAPVPVVGADDVLVRLTNVSLCGTDMHIWEDDYPTDLPIVQGHEMSGLVEAVGSGVTEVAVGARVAIDPVISCGSCYPCSIGRFNVCENLSVLGCYRDGGLVEVLGIGADKVHVIPEELALDLAAMGEPASIAMQAVNRGRPSPGETAIVLGCGPIGLFAALYLTDLGVDVIAADTEASRLTLAQEFGAVHTLLVDARAPFPSATQAAAISRLAGPAGPPLVIEATGVPDSLQNAVRIVSPAGRVVQVGISPRSVALAMKDLPFKELDLLGSRNSLGLIPEGLALLARHPRAARTLMTHRFPFDRLDEAFRLMQSRTEAVGKIMIDMPGSESRLSPAASETSSAVRA